MTEFGSQKEFFDDIGEVEHHATAIFPDDTNLTCTLAAAEAANTFGTWAEIQDSATTTFSSKLASNEGHLVSMVIESLSEIDTIYLLEISYGADKTILTRWRFAGTTKFQNPSHQNRIRAVHIPAGETIYYRMKTATAVADTALVHFRYFLHG